jgi:hypothetical protein
MSSSSFSADDETERPFVSLFHAMMGMTADEWGALGAERPMPMMERAVADDIRTVSFQDPGYAAATSQVLAAPLLAQGRDESFQNGFSALLINLAMLVEHEPGATTNKNLREKCELIGRTIFQQVKMLRQQYEASGQRMFDHLAAGFDQRQPQPSIQ